MRQKKGGFTIVEVILASLILAISLIGGAVFLSANRTNLVYATRQRLATWAAIYKVEQLKSADYTSSLLTAGTTNESLTLNNDPFTRRTIVTDIGGNYKQVTVSMDWGNGKFPLSLTTYIAPKN